MWRLLSVNLFSRSLDIEGQWVVSSLIVEKSMISLPGAAAIEAGETDVEAAGVIDRVEALRTVFSVDGLIWPRRREI